MKRRQFLENAGLAFTGLIWLPQFVRAQDIATADGLAAVSVDDTPAGGCTPSYAAPLGSGNRTSSITLSSDNTYFNDPTGILDGNNTSSNSYNILDPSPGGYFRFDFGSAITIQAIKWYQNKTTSHGVWQIQGSNDASAWTNIGSTFTLGGATTSTVTAISANTTAYRYYQFVKVSGSFDQTTFFWEIEFGICP